MHQTPHSIRTILRLVDNKPNFILRVLPGSGAAPCRNAIDPPGNNIDLSSSSLFCTAMHARKHRCGALSERRTHLFSLASTQAAVTSPSANRRHYHRRNVAGTTCILYALSQNCEKRLLASPCLSASLSCPQGTPRLPMDRFS